MEDSVTDLVKQFEESEDATRDARKLSERDRDYRDGKQLTADEEETLRKRGQPPVIFNRIQRKMDYLSGLEKQTRKDPKAFPRNPDDEDAANAATDGIRYVCDAAKWDSVRSDAWDNLLCEGTAAVLVGHKQTAKGIEPDLQHIPWDRYFYDPHSAKADLSDKAYDGIVTWMDVDRAWTRWPEGKDIITETWMKSKDSDTYDDKPKYHMWSDYKRKRVRIVEQYYLRQGIWYRCVYTEAGHLEPPAPSPYIDENGQPENPIKSVSLYVDRDNNRFGAVRVLISPQDEINKRRSKGLHLITMRQIRASRAVDSDPEVIRREMAKPDGIVMAEEGEFEILPSNDMAAANLQLLQEAKNEIDLLGANAAMAGKNESDMSGRAILAQQQGGMVEVARMFDRLRHLSLEVYEAIWNRIRQFWTAEKWVRVTDTDRNMRFVGLNQPVTMQQLAQEVMQGDERAIKTAAGIVGEELLQAALQQDEQALTILGSFVQQNAQQVVEVRNEVGAIEIDIVIDEGMDTPTVQSEQFDAIVKMMPALGPAAQTPQFIQMIIQASQLRDKDKLAKMLETPPDPQQMQQQQQQEAIAVAGATAEIEKTQSETAKNVATAQATQFEMMAAA